MDNNYPIFHLKLHKCKCGHVLPIKDMEMKMGGLLCTKCRIIMFQPYVDEEYFAEYHRRNKEREENNKNESN